MCRIDHVSFNFELYARIVDCIGGNGDALGEAAKIVGVVTHLNGALLARHHGFLRPCGSGAATTGAHVGKNKRFVARIGEGELTVAVAALLDGTVVVNNGDKLNLGTVVGVLCCNILCMNEIRCE